MKIGLVQGVAMLSWLSIIIFTGSPLIVFPLALILPISPHLYRMCQDFLAGAFFCCVNFFVVMFWHTKVVITGDLVDRIPANDRGIVICNHRTQMDWFFFWILSLRRFRLQHHKIVLKKGFDMVPPLGWAMSFFNFLFLYRDWEKDKGPIKRLLTFFKVSKYPVILLLFPEGTDLTENTKAKSDKHATSKGLPPLDYCVYPRDRGFTYMAKCLKGNCDAVYDLTIAYPDIVPQSVSTLWLGNFPKTVHFHIKRVPIEQIPLEKEDGSDTKEWLFNTWAEKEKRLKKFYQKGRLFFTENDNDDVDIETGHEQTQKKIKQHDEELSKIWPRVMIGVLSIQFLGVFSLLAAWHYNLVWWAWFLGQVAMFGLVYFIHGGFSTIEADYVIKKFGQEIDTKED